eukprot:1348652-Amorphochlora_amoeboformis.AAC.1
MFTPHEFGPHEFGSHEFGQHEFGPQEFRPHEFGMFHPISEATQTRISTRKSSMFGFLGRSILRRIRLVTTIPRKGESEG